VLLIIIAVIPQCMVRVMDGFESRSLLYNCYWWGRN